VVVQEAAWIPTAAAIPRMDTPSKPVDANSETATSRMRSLVVELGIGLLMATC